MFHVPLLCRRLPLPSRGPHKLEDKKQQSRYRIQQEKCVIQIKDTEGGVWYTDTGYNRRSVVYTTDRYRVQQEECFIQYTQHTDTGYSRRSVLYNTLLTRYTLDTWEGASGSDSNLHYIFGTICTI